MTSMLQREVMDPRPVVPDLVTVPVPAGATVLIASDLHLRADSSSITAHVEEVIVARLEQGAVALEESIKIYERGEALKAHCDKLLKNAEMRVEKITLGIDGKPKGVAPLDVD